VNPKTLVQVLSVKPFLNFLSSGVANVSVLGDRMSQARAGKKLNFSIILYWRKDVFFTNQRKLLKQITLFF